MFGREKVLICSDGLYRTHDDGEMEEIFCREFTDFAGELIEKALEKTGEMQDNITVLVLEIKKAWEENKE